MDGNSALTYGPWIALAFIVVVAWLLLKKYYPHAVLLFAGMLMLSVSWLLGNDFPELNKPTGAFGIDLFKLIKDSFAGTNAGVGLMIMSIGGFVAYSDKIGASHALVKLAMRPLRLLKNYPHLTAAAVIPIGQILFITIPSAAGLGLLLMASVFPILVNLGVSRLSAVSVITACTAFGIGPASAITASASEIVEQPVINYFISDQLPLVVPLMLLTTVSYYFVNRYFDKKAAGKTVNAPVVEKENEPEVDVPRIYAIIPVLPLILLIVFSEFFHLLGNSSLDTTTAMFMSLFVAIFMEAVRTRSWKTILQSLSSFWNGMGNIFKTVVTLIIAADIFSQGLISLGFIDGLVYASQNAGLEAVGIGIVMTIMIFLASMLMGSGNAAFFAFAPLVPKIAANFGVKTSSMILPMNLAASMGRTVSPVAGVLIATAEIAKVDTLAIVKRNLIPFALGLVVMLIYHFI
ncbi:MAG: C4-dicarboxylate transporter DcuC [Flavobacteriia bacterium]|nr:C4-dicarboxylate transporter DcuC [Flavobacteriia bacterium]